MNTIALDKTILNVKLSKDLKSQAQQLADDIGVPLSTIVIANLREFVRSRTFSVSALPRLNPTIEGEIASAIDDYKNGKNVSPVLSSAKSLDDYLSNL
jgi:antitoxin component of RelBE/YafQ-DinJ toxin-antitoxin module